MVLILAMLVFPPLLLGLENRLGDLVPCLLLCGGACGPPCAVIFVYHGQRPPFGLTQLVWRFCWRIAILHFVALLENRL